MLFKLTHKLPEKCWVAVSGGADSMAALHWLCMGRKVEGIIHIDHNTGEFSDDAMTVVWDTWVKMEGMEIRWVHLDGTTPLYGSLEEYWRDARYAAYKEIDAPVVVAHNLDDCVEEYVMNTIVRGRMGTIPYEHGNCIRPFRLWRRDSILEYCVRKGIHYLDDPSNKDTKFKRNLIRHNIMPELLKLNPGLYKVVTKMIIRDSTRL